MLAAPSASLQPAPDDVLALRRLVIDGRALDALAHSRRFAPLEEWTHPAAARVAGWLCEGLGAPKRARALTLRAVRRTPRSALAKILRVYAVLETRGPLEAHAAIAELRALTPMGEGATSDDEAELAMIDAHALARLRAFDLAASALEEGARLGASPRRVAALEAQILAQRDRNGEALEAARRALSHAPDAPSSISLVAHLHVRVGEPDAALALLRAGAERTQSSELALQLATMLRERRLYEERHTWIERWADRVPLLEDPARLAALRADAAYDRGDLEESLRLARTVPSGFHARVAARLAETMGDAGARRVVLDVPFVQQHDMTCAPATLSALAAYWKMPAEHLQVADAICYDGTPHHSQRTWAEEHGFVARELTATWPVVIALLDRGVPLTVAIVQGADAHMQAIVGYDTRRGTLLLRDPSHPERIEALAEEWLDTWRATGPQAMVMVPRADEARLDGIALPEAPLYDELHRTNAALGRHDRVAAVVAADTLEKAAPGHRLAIQARRALAAYDQDPARVLACARATAAAFPDFVTAHLDALACMRATRPRDERIAAAEALVASHPREPLYAEALARELSADARAHARATRLLRRAIRMRPDRHASLAMLAEIRWAQRDFGKAIELHRLAACLGRFDERAVQAYFIAARAEGREQEALALIEARAADLGRLHAAPTLTLCQTLDALGRTDDGLRVLDAVLAARPDDGDLLLFAAEARAALGELDTARALLARADTTSRRSDWLRSAAALALRAGAFDERRRLLEQLLALEPLDVASHHAYASALAASDGTPAARLHLRRARERAPHLRVLSHLYLDWIRGAGATEAERCARAVLATDPDDAYARRELGEALLAQGRLDEARAALDAAAEVAPSDASIARARASLLQREGKREEARAARWGAIELDPDRADLIGDLLAGASDPAEREAAIDRIHALVHARSVSGTGIIALYMHTRALRDAASVGRSVEAARTDRPSHWATWSCAVRHRSFTGEHEAAGALADEACARFPLVAALWIDRADALVAAGMHDEATTALERAVQIDAVDEIAHVRLAGAYVRAGNHARAGALLERAVARLPTSTRPRAHLADLLWGLGEREPALRHVEIALAMNADDERAWGLLDEWSTAAGRTQEGLSRIEAFAAERPWNGNAMLVLARARWRRGDGEGALGALDRATEADPLLQDAHDLRAAILAMLSRFDDARGACAPAVYGAAVPRELRGRQAWVRARRGELSAASTDMRALLAEHPDYTWGWSNLADWCRKRGAPLELLEAAKELVRTAPALSAAHHQLAEALFECGDRVAARRSLARAVDLAPGDADVAEALFEAALEDGDDAVAGSMIPLLRGARPAAALAAEARLRARRGDAGALDALRALATHEAADGATFDGARRACVHARLGDACHALLGELMATRGAHASVGELWVRACVLRGDTGAVTTAMRTLDPSLPAVRAGGRAWIEVLVETGAKDLARDAARIVGARFAPCDDATWAQVAGALLHGALEECVTWTADWQSRPDATPWMLLNVASALRETGRDEEAAAVVRHAAPLEPADGASRSHRAWLALHLALQGEAAEARQWLTRAGDLDGVPVLSGVAALVEALLVVPEWSGRSMAFFQARRRLAAAGALCKFTVLVRAQQRAEKQLARQAGFPLGTLWLRRQALLVAAAIAGAAIVLVGFFGYASSSASSGSVTHFPVGILAVIAIRFFMSRSKKA